MTPWLIPVRTGHEAEIADEIGGYAPLCATYCRRKDDSRPRLHYDILWPGYVFAELTDYTFHDAVAVKHVYPTWKLINPVEWRRVLEAIDFANLEVARMEREVRAGELVSEFNAGQILEIIGGPFAGQMVAFRKMATAPHNRPGDLWGEHPVFGRMELRAVDVKAAE